MITELGTMSFKEDTSEYHGFHSGKINVKLEREGRLPISFTYSINTNDREQENYNNIVLGTVDKINKIADEWHFSHEGVGGYNRGMLSQYVRTFSYAVFKAEGSHKEVKIKLVLDELGRLKSTN